MSVPPRRDRGQSRNEQVVRVGALERTLETFNGEVGAKTTMLLARFHGKYIGPLERRIEALENRLTPWYVKLWGYLKFGWRVLFWRRSVEPATAGPFTAGEPVTIPNPDGSPTAAEPTGESTVTEIDPERRIITLDSR